MIIKQFANVTNAVELKSNVSELKEMTLIDSTMIISEFHLLTAIEKAKLNQKHKLKTKSMASEVLYCLAPNTNIMQSFVTFGIKPDTTSVIAIYHDGIDQITDISKDQTTDISKDQITNTSKDQITDISKDQITDISKDKITDTIKDQITDTSKDQITDTIKDQTNEDIEKNEINNKNAINGTLDNNNNDNNSAFRLIHGKEIELTFNPNLKLLKEAFQFNPDLQLPN